MCLVASHPVFLCRFFKGECLIRPCLTHLRHKIVEVAFVIITAALEKFNSLYQELFLYAFEQYRRASYGHNREVCSLVKRHLWWWRILVLNVL